MLEKQNRADSHRLISLADKMHDKRYRDGYVATHTRQVLAKQMREFRGSLSQTEFAELIDKRQTIVSRLENPSYIGWSLSTMLEIASNLNVAVFARFVDFPTFFKYSGKLSNSDLRPAPYDQKTVDDFACFSGSENISEAIVPKPKNMPDRRWSVQLGQLWQNFIEQGAVSSSFALALANEEEKAKLRSENEQLRAENERLKSALLMQSFSIDQQQRALSPFENLSIRNQTPASKLLANSITRVIPQITWLP